MPPLLLVGAALGCAAMYLLDPEQGKRRRDRIARQGTRVQKRAVEVLDKGRDLKNRARYVAARARSVFSPRDPGDRVLTERVRAKMGRHVAHPGAIEVSATRGCVVLTGSILPHEHHDFISAVADIPGVEDIYDRLSVFERAEGLSELQSERRGDRHPNWSPAARLAVGAAGTLLATKVVRGGLSGWLYTAVGAALLLRAATNKPITREGMEELLHVTGRSESGATLGDAAKREAETAG